MVGGTVAALARDARFEVCRELGRSADAAVYLVWDRADEGFRAMKVLGEERRARTEVLRRFVREARTLTRIDHPNILKLYRTGLLDGRPYVVTEFADGGSAADWLERHGPMPDALALEMVTRVARAVDTAHRAGLVHRHLKPSNVMLSRRGTLVGDFGVGRPGGPGQDFAAPEQMEGVGKVGHAVDVYALGATLYTLVTDEAPEDLHIRVARGRLPEVHPLLEQVVVRACQRQPGQRHPSAAAFAAELEEVARDLSAGRGAGFLEEEPTLEAPLPATVEVPIVAGPLQALRRMWESWRQA